MEPRDIERLVEVSRPSIHPTGETVVFAVTRPSISADANVGQLWSAPVDGSAPARRLTRGFRDSAPRFSPDGRSIAFLRATPGAPAQLQVIPAHGGEPVQMTDARLGAGEFRWSPDGTRIAYLCRVPEQGRYGTVEGRGGDAEDARRITSLRYKSNGLGYTIDRRSQLFVVDVPATDDEPVYDPAPTRDSAPRDDASRDSSPDRAVAVPESRRLTSDDIDYAGPVWATDDTILVIAARHDSRDVDLRSDLWKIAASGGEPTAVPTGREDLALKQVATGTDGRVWLLAQELGEGARDFVGATTGLFLLERGGEAVRLTDAESVDLGDPGSSISITGDGSALVQERTRGTVQLVRVRPDG